MTTNLIACRILVLLGALGLVLQQNARAVGDESPLSPDFSVDDVDRWTAALGSPKVETRWYGAYALGQIGAEATPASSALAALLVDPKQHEYVRATAAWSLGRIGSTGRPALEALTAALDSTLPTVRRHAAEALARLGPKAESAVDELEVVLSDADLPARVAAAGALWSIEQRSAAVDVLIGVVRAGANPGAYEAVEELGEIAPADEAALAALVEALGAPQADVRRAAARAIGRTGPATLELLRPLLESEEAFARYQAVEALGWLGPEAVDPLIDALRNEDPMVRARAARALGRFGAAARHAVGPLVAAVNDPQAEVRRQASEALRLIRAEAMPR